MSTRITHRRSFEGLSSPCSRGARFLLAAVSGSALLLSACGDGDETDAASAGGDVATSPDEEADVEDEGDDEGAEDSASSPVNEATIPANMPEGIPIPDEHVVLRSDSMTGAAADEEFGEHVAANIAISGTVEEQRAFYETELRAAYGDLEYEAGMDAEALVFRGEWFESGRVWVTENEGQFDSQTLDTSHLPVLLTVQVWEHDVD